MLEFFFTLSYWITIISICGKFKFMLDDQSLNDYVKLYIAIPECWKCRKSNVDLNIVDFF